MSPSPVGTPATNECEEVVDQNRASWNRVMSWLCRIERVSRAFELTAERVRYDG